MEEGSPGSAPLMAARMRAVSSTERAMGPTLSRDQHRAMAPVRATRPNVGRSPVQPQRVDGELMEPQVSVPIANATAPAATAEALPALEPEEPWLGSHGLLVRPPNQTSPMARAPRVSLATRT